MQCLCVCPDRAAPLFNLGLTPATHIAGAAGAGGFLSLCACYSGLGALRILAKPGAAASVALGWALLAAWRGPSLDGPATYHRVTERLRQGEGVIEARFWGPECPLKRSVERTEFELWCSVLETGTDGGWWRTENCSFARGYALQEQPAAAVGAFMTCRHGGAVEGAQV